MAYTDATTVKRYLGTSATGDDTLIGECIARAQSLIDALCNRTFEAAADTTRTFDASTDADGDDLLLDGDLCALTTVTDDGVTVALADVRRVPRHSTPWYLLRRAGGWDGEVAVTGRWAYSATAPAAIQQACIRLAVWLYRQKDSHSDPGQPQMTDSGAWLMPSRMPKDISDMLAPFRRIAT